MTPAENPNPSPSPSSLAVALPRLVALVVLLYGFLVSIGLIGKSFKLMGGGFIDGVIQSASSPLVGLFVGILATTLVQSSSTTTSVVVAMVGSGTMPVATAIPMIMGANIGTSVTNTLVSLGHIRRGNEFFRAFSASTVHDFFNILAVAVLFPLQVATNFLGVMATGLEHLFENVGGLKFTSPLKMITDPAVKGITSLLGEHPWVLLLVAMVIMFSSLRFLMLVLKSVVMSRLESFFDMVIFKNAGRALLFGLVVTVLVQSSSVTTSLIIPFAGAGMLSLTQIFPYTLGANVGTTVTAILASLAVGEAGAVTVAFAHLCFNVTGIALIWPIPAIRRIPMDLSRWLAGISLRNRWLPLAYIGLLFYLLPFVVIMVLR